jgi:Flp pilus assembly protein TadD
MRTILGLVAVGALMTSCAHDASQDSNTAAIPATPEVATARPIPLNPSETAPGPVDAVTARAAWKDGVTRFDNGDYTGAVPQLKLAVAGEPNDAYRVYLLGLAQWKSHDLPGAENSLTESVRLDSTRLKTWINLARVRNERNDRNGALEASEKALDLLPTSAEALHQKGRALLELNRHDEAQGALKTAHTLDPGNGYIANTLGLLLIQSGRPADAIEPLEAAKQLLPNVAYVRNNLGVAYERNGMIVEAKVEYAAAVEAGDMGGKAMKSLVRLGAKDTTDPSAVAVAAAAVPPAESK